MGTGGITFGDGNDFDVGVKWLIFFAVRIVL